MPSATRRHLTLLAVPLLAGALLRLSGLGRQGLFLDEAFSIDLALRPWDQLIRLAAQDVHPLLYYTLLKLFITPLPLAEWPARLFSALCSAGALTLAIALSYRLAGLRVALAAGLLLGWSSLSLYYAQEARMYALFELLWLLAPALLLQALTAERRRWGWWAAWALATAAAVNVQFFGAMLWALGALAGLLVIALRRRWPTLGPWLAAQLLVAALVLPIATLAASAVRRGVDGTWVPEQVDLLQLAALTLWGFTPARGRFLNGELLAPWPWNTLPAAAWLLLTLLALGGALLGWRRDERPGARQLTALGLAFGLGPPLLAFALLRLTGQPFWSPKIFIGASAWLLLAVATGWAALPPRVGLTALLAALLLNIGPLWAYQTTWIKDFGREAVRGWVASVPPTAPLVLDRVSSALVWRFYLPPAIQPQLFALHPQPDGSLALLRLRDDGTLRGPVVAASCADLPTNKPLALYDPARRREGEAERWPPCVQQAGGWRFDTANGWVPLP